MSRKTVLTFLFHAYYAVGIYAIIRSDDIENEISKEGIDNIFNPIIESVSYCKNVYTSACELNEYSSAYQYSTNIYPKIRNYVISDILSQPPTHTEVYTLTLEKKLFQKCMKLGSHESKQAKLEKEDFVQQLISFLYSNIKNWQQKDYELGFLGYGNTFFDIHVELDPDNATQNIISLKPPSLFKIKTLRNLMQAAIYTSRNGNERNDFSKFYDLIIRKNGSAVLSFINGYIENCFTIIQIEKPEYHSGKMTLNQWIEEYSNKSGDTYLNIINWKHIIKLRFNDVNVLINDNEIILIKNIPYFYALAKFLRNNRNELISAFVITKFLTENLRYIDWQKAESLGHVKRSHFCFSQTKLYGASFKLLRDLNEEEASNENYYYQVISKMLPFIVNAINDEINRSNILFETEKDYLKSQVKWISRNALNQGRKKVKEYIPKFTMFRSYFRNIIEYRKEMKFIELKSLRNWKAGTGEPFSIVDLDKPRNRFILSLYINSNSSLSSTLPKEFHYGVYGVKTAGFLFALLNENRHQFGLIERKDTDWFPHPTYSIPACFFPTNVDVYGVDRAIDTLTELFAVRIAYKAMLKDLLYNKEIIIYKPCCKNPRRTDQLFLSIYAKYHCYLGKKVMDTVFSNLNEFYSAYQCPAPRRSKSSLCPHAAFEIQDSRIFSRNFII